MKKKHLILALLFTSISLCACEKETAPVEPEYGFSEELEQTQDTTGVIPHDSSKLFSDTKQTYVPKGNKDTLGGATGIAEQGGDGNVVEAYKNDGSKPLSTEEQDMTLSYSAMTEKYAYKTVDWYNENIINKLQFDLNYSAHPISGSTGYLAVNADKYINFCVESKGYGLLIYKTNNAYLYEMNTNKAYKLDNNLTADFSATFASDIFKDMTVNAKTYKGVTVKKAVVSEKYPYITKLTVDTKVVANSVESSTSIQWLVNTITDTVLGVYTGGNTFEEDQDMTFYNVQIVNPQLPSYCYIKEEDISIISNYDKNDIYEKFVEIKGMLNITP